ncbi:MAG: HAD family hydrolase [Verrucomicrobiae bacterium]|nr:HAD family hydrolase [Verrucomicrobiae bacterium]
MTGLREFAKANLRPLQVEEAGMDPKLARMPGIRAVVFDLYGTLLISAAGGIFGNAPDPEGLPGFEEVYWNLVREHHERRRAEGVAHPEVEVRDLWVESLRRLGKVVPASSELEFSILAHECRVNPVWPMPRAAETLSRLAGAGVSLGIISNAQFYTLPVMEGLFGSSLEELGFHPGLQVFSFEVGEGKPSPRLFEILGERAAGLGLDPSEVLYVGNDFRKDVLPARAIGFRTALFAGDARSLRLGGLSEDEARETADAVITDLAQVAELF